jgi:hypothetical protein
MIATRVISVRGLNPAVMLADPNFAYVGRKCYGWPGSPWGNPFRVYSSRMQSFDNRLVGGLWLAEASKAIGDLPSSPMDSLPAGLPRQPLPASRQGAGLLVRGVDAGRA